MGRWTDMCDKYRDKYNFGGQNFQFCCMFELFQNKMLLGEHYKLKLKNNIGGSNITKYFLKVNRVLLAYNLNVLTSFSCNIVTFLCPLSQSKTS